MSPGEQLHVAPDMGKGHELHNPIKTDRKAQLPLPQGLTLSTALDKRLRRFQEGNPGGGQVAQEPAQEKRNDVSLPMQLFLLVALNTCFAPPVTQRSLCCAVYLTGHLIPV